jgi:integrase
MVSIRMALDEGDDKAPASLLDRITGLTGFVWVVWWLWVYLAAKLGLRPSEACALRREDFDLEQGTITISRSVPDREHVDPESASDHLDLFDPVPDLRVTHRPILPRGPRRGAREVPEGATDLGARIVDVNEGGVPPVVDKLGDLVHQDLTLP